MKVALTAIVSRLAKKCLGFILVVMFYLMINLHIFIFIDYYLLNYAFTEKQSIVIAIVSLKI